MDKDKRPEVTLRAMEPEDLDVLYHVENDNSMWNISTSNVPYSRYALHNYIADAKNDIYIDGQIRMMIENEGGIVVGVIDLVNFDAKHQRAELGIIIMEQYRRQGYAKSAIRALVEYARNTLHLKQIYAVVGVDNRISRHCLMALGFSSGVILQQWLCCKGSYQDAAVMQLFIEKA